LVRPRGHDKGRTGQNVAEAHTWTRVFVLRTRVRGGKLLETNLEQSFQGVSGASRSRWKIKKKVVMPEGREKKASGA